MHTPISMSAFSTDDLDHAREFVTARFGVHSRIVRGLGAFGFRYRSFTGNDVMVGSGGWALGQVLRATVPEQEVDDQHVHREPRVFGPVEERADPQPGVPRSEDDGLERQRRLKATGYTGK